MLQMPNEVDDDDTESMSEDEPDAAPAAAGRRRVAPEQVVTDAFHYALAIGGKSITVSSMMSFDIEDENFEPTYVSRVDPGEVDAEQFAKIVNSEEVSTMALRQTVWELMTAATKELPPGADALVDAWRLALLTRAEIFETHSDGEHDEITVLDNYFAGTFFDWSEVDAKMRPSLFIAAGGSKKYDYLHSGKKLLRTLRQLVQNVEENGETTNVKFLLRMVDSGVPVAPNPPRAAGHGGFRARAGRAPEQKKVLLLLHLGTKQTEQNGAIKFFRTDAAEPLMVIKNLEDLPVIDADDPLASVAATIEYAYDLLVSAGSSVPSRTGEGLPPQAFRPAGSATRQGENAKQVVPVKLLDHITARKIGRAAAETSAYTHELVLVFPYGTQPVTGTVPGLHPPFYDFTPVLKPDATATAAGSKAQRTAAAQGNKMDTMHSLRVAAVAFRNSNVGDARSGTPPFAKIIVRSTDHQFRSDLARVITL